MHYFWLKKKWFFDIITSNLLLALIVTATPYEYDPQAEINYAEVAPFNADIVRDTELEPLCDIGSVPLLEFYIEIEVNDSETYIETEDVFAIETEPSLISITKYERYISNDIKELHSISHNPSDIEIVYHNFYISQPDPEVLSVIPTSYFSDIEIVYHNFYISQPDPEVLSVIHISRFADVEVIHGIETASSDLSNVELSNLTDLYVYDNFVDLNTVRMRVCATRKLNFNDVGPRTLETNFCFYTPVVLELKMSNLGVPKREVFVDIDVSRYITRFVDMQGWIVEDDLTGKKFKDLR